MSAIWGVIAKKNAVSNETRASMRESMREFRIDRYDEVADTNVYMACGHQYFTNESVNDISPYYDKDEKLWFAADCYLYNREELIKALKKNGSIVDKNPEDLGDAMLSYRAYQCFGERFVEKLRGSFSFVIYQEKKQSVLLYTDQLAQRYLAYRSDEDGICFGTVYQPILAYMGRDKTKLCKEWICAAYTDCTADTVKLPEKTVYEGVFHVEPGHYVEINLQNQMVRRNCYWNPLLKACKLPKMTDEEYRKLFLDTFEGAVKGLLRAKGQTGIMLSGGLDSSSVAAMAARHLSKENKKLFSYTAIPAEGYQYENNRFYIENETAWVRAQQQMHPNIEPRFVNSDHVNCFTGLKDCVSVHRQPVKPALNMPNVTGMMQAAQQDGCSIMLSGQNGNATISYGNIMTFVYQKLVRGHFVTAYREMKAFCTLRRVSRKRFVKVFLKSFHEKFMQPFAFGEDCFLKENDIKKYRLFELTKKVEKARGTGFLDSVKQRKGFCYMPLVFQHMGFYATCSGLQYGILSLDPTLTTEMLELCISMPIDCYVKGGKERRAVRDYMKGYVTDVVLDNHEGRGIQAADYAYRVKRDWGIIKDEVLAVLSEPALCGMMDEEKLMALVKEAETTGDNPDKTVVAKMAVMASLGYFLRQTKDSIS